MNQKVQEDETFGLYYCCPLDVASGWVLDQRRDDGRWVHFHNTPDRRYLRTTREEAEQIRHHLAAPAEHYKVRPIGTYPLPGEGGDT